MRPEMMPAWLRHLIVLVGLSLIVLEAIRNASPRWHLLVVYTGMIGLTSLRGLDRKGGGQPDGGPR